MKSNTNVKVRVLSYDMSQRQVVNICLYENLSTLSEKRRDDWLRPSGATTCRTLETIPSHFRTYSCVKQKTWQHNISNSIMFKLYVVQTTFDKTNFSTFICQKIKQITFISTCLNQPLCHYIELYI
jgi:hypothetical protein